MAGKIAMFAYLFAAVALLANMAVAECDGYTKLYLGQTLALENTTYSIVLDDVLLQNNQTNESYALFSLIDPGGSIGAGSGYKVSPGHSKLLAKFPVLNVSACSVETGNGTNQPFAYLKISRVPDDYIRLILGSCPLSEDRYGDYSNSISGVDARYGLYLNNISEQWGPENSQNATLSLKKSGVVVATYSLGPGDTASYSDSSGDRVNITVCYADAGAQRRGSFVRYGFGIDTAPLGSDGYQLFGDGGVGCAFFRNYAICFGGIDPMDWEPNGNLPATIAVYSLQDDMRVEWASIPPYSSHEFSIGEDRINVDVRRAIFRRGNGHDVAELRISGAGAPAETLEPCDGFIRTYNFLDNSWDSQDRNLEIRPNVELNGKNLSYYREYLGDMDWSTFASLATIKKLPADSEGRYPLNITYGHISHVLYPGNSVSYITAGLENMTIDVCDTTAWESSVKLATKRIELEHVDEIRYDNGKILVKISWHGEPISPENYVVSVARGGWMEYDNVSGYWQNNLWNNETKYWKNLWDEELNVTVAIRAKESYKFLAFGTCVLNMSTPDFTGAGVPASSCIFPPEENLTQPVYVPQVEKPARNTTPVSIPSASQTTHSNGLQVTQVTEPKPSVLSNTSAQGTPSQVSPPAPQPLENPPQPVVKPRVDEPVQPGIQQTPSSPCISPQKAFEASVSKMDLFGIIKNGLDLVFGTKDKQACG